MIIDINNKQERTAYDFFFQLHKQNIYATVNLGAIMLMRAYHHKCYENMIMFSHLANYTVYKYWYILS